jgi:hypothetical protein
MRCQLGHLDSATVVTEPGGHSATGVDVEIWRLPTHYDLLIVEAKREFFGSGGRFPQSNHVVKQSEESRHRRHKSYSQLSKDRSTRD